MLINRAQVSSEQSLPVTVTWHSVRIRPTRLGIVYFIVLLAFLMGSINYNNNLAFFLTFLLGSLVFVSIFHTYRNLSGITVLSGYVKPVFNGDPAIFEFNIRRDGSERYAIDFTFDKEHVHRYDFNRLHDRTVRVSIPANNRGLFDPGHLSISTNFPFGLFNIRSSVEAGIKCLVYPRPLSGPLKITYSGDGDGEDGQAVGAGVDDFDGLKPYIPGDQLNHISWKTFSRGQGLFTKQFIGLSGKNVFFDWSRLSEYNIEHRLSRLCDMVLKADVQQMNYGLILPNRKIEPGSGALHLKTCLRELALVQRGELTFNTGKPNLVKV